VADRESRRARDGGSRRQASWSEGAVSSRSYTIACLAGAGVGPELMGQASRVMRTVAELHDLETTERHVPLGGEVLARVGPRLPNATRSGHRSADAVLLELGAYPEQGRLRTLERAVAPALRQGARTTDMVGEGVAATTREFTETVLSGLVRSRTDTELSMEAHT
jgi:isocitrate/isopropylmalate dehydrogenase